MRATSVRIRCEVIGRIWMPYATYYKSVDETFTVCLERDAEHSIHGFSDIDALRDALLRITNDGDFRSCAISRGGALMDVTFTRGGRLITRSRFLVGTGENADLFTDELPEWDEQ